MRSSQKLKNSHIKCEGESSSSLMFYLTLTTVKDFFKKHIAGTNILRKPRIFKKASPEYLPIVLTFSVLRAFITQHDRIHYCTNKEFSVQQHPSSRFDS